MQYMFLKHSFTYSLNIRYVFDNTYIFITYNMYIFKTFFDISVNVNHGLIKIFQWALCSYPLGVVFSL